MTILITGSAGLIGSALMRHYRGRHADVCGVDWRSTRCEERVDVADAGAMAPMLNGVTGIIHLAAVSRVIDGQRDPARCWVTNVEATGQLLDAAMRAQSRPWFIYASSREVYGMQEIQPVAEDAPLQPVNAYARSKVAAEELVDAARRAGFGDFDPAICERLWQRR